MISAPYGLCRSHEEARAVLAYAVPGADVSIYRPRLRRWNQKNAESDRAYTITLPFLGRDPVCVMGSYSLPIAAESLAKGAREEVQRRCPR